MEKTLTIFQDVERVTETKEFKYDLPLCLKTDCDDEPEFILIQEDMSAIYIHSEAYNKTRTIKVIDNFELELDCHGVNLRAFYKTCRKEDFNAALNDAMLKLKDATFDAHKAFE